MYFLSANVNAFERFIAFIGKRAEEPKVFGAFHLVSVCIILAVSLLVIYLRKKITEKFLAYFMLACGIIMALFEVYKQVVLSYIPEADVWAYPWSIFPFQFCSTPIYLTLLTFVFYKTKKTVYFRGFTAFLGTYSLIAAIVVLTVGMESVFDPIIGINIQTTVHHGLMFVLGVAIISSKKITFSLDTAIKTYKIFFALTVTAILLNNTVGIGKDFDMFYLAETSSFIYPVFNEIFGGKLPHFVYVVGYMVLFTLAASIVMWIGYRLTVKKEKNDIKD